MAEDQRPDEAPEGTSPDPVGSPPPPPAEPGAAPDDDASSLDDDPAATDVDASTGDDDAAPTDADATGTHDADATGAHDDAAPTDDAAESSPSTSPLEDFEAEEAGRSRWGKGLLITLIGLLVIGGAYAGAAWFLGDQVPSGTSVAGVPIGGLTEQEARDRLATDLADISAEPVPVSLGDGQTTIDPTDVDLRLDPDATLDGLTGFSLDPRELLSHLTGAGARPAVSSVDEAALQSALEGVAGALDVPPVEGQIELVGTTPQATEPAEGTGVDVDAAADLVVSEWLTAERPLELPSRSLEPTIDAEAVEVAMDELARPLVSAPVAVSVGDHLVELTTEDLAEHAQFVADGEALALELDGAALADVVTEREPGIDAEGEDARFELQDGTPVIVPSVAGRGLAAEDVAEAVAAAATSSTDRTAEVALTETEPEFTTADAEALGIKEIVAEFSTPVPYNPVRTQNLQVGSQYVTGTIVEPGENFSLLDAVSPITRERGFVSSGVVEAGFATTALGGGLSQLSTNMYNVGFLAGMDDVEHKPHSRWFERYPAGREATLWDPTVDMVWHNNTDYGLFVHSFLSDGRLYSRLWGTKVWDVQTSTSNHYNFTEPRTVYNEDPECEPESGGRSGFSVNVVRERHRDGELVDEQSWSWTYQPWNRVICGSPEDEEPEGETAEESQTADADTGGGAGSDDG